MSRRILLASASPRRKELLEAACFAVDVRAPDADETWPGGDARQAAIALAQRKVARVTRIASVAGLVLAADTVVMHGGTALGKPRDAADAAAMLRRLAG